MAKITKDMIISEALKQHPKLVEVFFEYGLGCMGCPMSQMESIENGAMAHGLSENEVEDLIKAANKTIEDEE